MQILKSLLYVSAQGETKKKVKVPKGYIDVCKKKYYWLHSINSE